MSRRERTGIVKPKKGPNKGKWLLQPSIDHPPYCVCHWCKKHRRLDEWAQVKEQILNRVSPHPDNRAASMLAAARLKDEVEAKLRSAVDVARSSNAALPTATTVKTVCDAYRLHHEKGGKRIDRDQYRIDQIESFFGEERDAASLTKADVNKFTEHLRSERKCAPATVERYLNTLVAVMNSAVKDDLLSVNPVAGLRRTKTKKKTKPHRFTPLQVEVLLGKAIDELERRRDDKRVAGIGTTRLPVSQMPLRGLCLVAYRTLMRPTNNFALRWEDLRIDVAARKGYFRLDRHKNVSRGINVEAPLAPSLLNYLMMIMPSDNPTGLVHPNPSTGEPYDNIRDQWNELVDLANGLLPKEEQITHRDFYQWRATGASEMVSRAGADPVMVARIMGDTSLKTVLEHYFDSSLAHMESIISKWDDTVVGGSQTSPPTSEPEKAA